MSRKAVNRLYENKAQLNSISMHLGESVGMTTYASEICALHLFQRFFYAPVPGNIFNSNIGWECCWHVLISLNISMFVVLDLSSDISEHVFLFFGRNAFLSKYSLWWIVFEAIARTVGHLSKSAEVMKLVNNLMKAPQMAATMQEFSKEMIKVIFKFVTLLHLRASFCFIIFTIVVKHLGIDTSIGHLVFYYCCSELLCCLKIGFLVVFFLLKVVQKWTLSGNSFLDVSNQSLKLTIDIHVV